MHFFKTVIGLTALITTVVAQSKNLFLTSQLSTVEAGTPINITYVASKINEPVTIKLRQGKSDHLKDVSILTQSATAGSYEWTPTRTLESGNNYALEIIQGSDINYSKEFTVINRASPGYASSATTTSSSITAPTYGSKTTITSVMPTPYALNVTSSGLRTVGTIGSVASMGIATSGGLLPMTRNATFSSATLTATSTGASRVTVTQQITATHTGAAATIGASSLLAMVVGGFVAVAQLL